METQEKDLSELEVERPKRPPKARLRPLLTLFAVLGLLIVSAVAIGLLPRLRREQALQAATESVREARPIVNVTEVRQAPANAPLELPGDLQPLVDSPIFARADGYLTKRYADIGDRVKNGQVLAEIETPDLDQQIVQARATLSNSQNTLVELEASRALAEANLRLAQKTADRWRELETEGTVSHQDADEKNSILEVRRAELAAARAKITSSRDLVAGNEANLRRLQEIKAFARVTAPFDGIVTARNVDVGTLINSGNGGPAREMFHVAEIGTLRVFVNVPQAYVGSIQAGQKVELRVQELPGQVFTANLARFTHAVDTTSRSMLAILLVPNPRGILLPGMYAQVRFAATRSMPAVLIPGDALLVGTKGTRVASVDAENHVRFRNIQVGIDYGNEVEVLSGLQAGDLVVMNPTDAVREGVRVDVRKSGDARH